LIHGQTSVDESRFTPHADARNMPDHNEVLNIELRTREECGMRRQRSVGSFFTGCPQFRKVFAQRVRSRIFLYGRWAESNNFNRGPKG
jgi:hypothetical protein